MLAAGRGCTACGDQKESEVTVDVHALVQYAHNIDDAVGPDRVVQDV